jgi:hypothetical protein
MPTARAISQESIYSTLYAALAVTDSIFQIWITLTFAVWSPRTSLSGVLIGACTGSYRVSTGWPPGFARGFEPWPVPNVASLIIGVGTIV